MSKKSSGCSDLSPELLRDLLRYEPLTGKLYWKERPRELFIDGSEDVDATFKSWNKRWAGKEAFTSDDGVGYRQGRIFGKSYRAHRVAWAIYHGAWPADEIDHINGCRMDNRLENLREATREENGRNAGAKITNTSGFKGVSWKKDIGKWRARILVSGVEHSLGVFDCPKEAHQAYSEAARRMHGEFAKVR